MSDKDQDGKDKRDKDKHEKDKHDEDKHDREELEFSTTTRGVQVAEYLNRIADGLRQGTLTLGAAGQTVHLQPAETIRLEVEAESRPDKGKGSLQLELSWKLSSPARESHEDVLAIETEPHTPQFAAYMPRGKDA